MFGLDPRGKKNKNNYQELRDDLLCMNGPGYEVVSPYNCRYARPRRVVSV